MNEINKSPLRFYTEMQAKKLSEKIKNENLVVDFAMRYGSQALVAK